MKALLGLVLLTLAISATAETVVPVDSVETFVNIRLNPQAGTEIVGRLHRGDELIYVQTVDGWHEVGLPGGGIGYIHADWATIVAEAPEPTEEVVAEVAPVPEEEVIAEVAPVPEEEVIAEVAPVPEEEVVADPTPPTSEGSVEVAAVVAVAAAGQRGPAGPPGPPGPPGPAGAAATGANGKSAVSLKGTENFLMRFKDETVGRNSQIFDDGNFVGIGTTTPKQRLEVNGSIQIHEQNSSVAGLMITQSSGDTGYILHNRASTLTIGSGSVDRITIDRNGNVGFAVERPAHPIDMVSGAHVTAGGVWTNSSSRERKEDISHITFEQALQALTELQPVQYRYKNNDPETYVGFIAEDVPDLVAMDDRKSLSTMDIVAVLTKVVQEQQKRIEELEARLDK
jgi:hypothetical protein